MARDAESSAMAAVRSAAVSPRESAAAGAIRIPFAVLSKAGQGLRGTRSPNVQLGTVNPAQLAPQVPLGWSSSIMRRSAATALSPAVPSMNRSDWTK